jgi:hypothetical protein
MSLPQTIALNAGTASRADTDSLAAKWGARTANVTGSQQQLALGEIPDETDWAAADVGYGVLLPDSDASPADKASGADAPAAVQQLLAARPDTVVLRWSKDVKPGFVRRYYPDGKVQDPAIGLTEFGTGKGRLPRYVVIVAGPAQIPWRVQYELEVRHAVGRLPLDGDALGNYIEAMLSGWPTCDVDVRSPLVWTVSLPDDITTLMRRVIADPLAKKLDDPSLPGLRVLSDASANGADLITELAALRPAFLATSSHGLAVADHAILRAALGTPIDRSGIPVEVAALTAAIPAGAIWYSQACCSAGSDAPTNYGGLVAPGAVLDALGNLAGLGPTVAPACLELLGRAHPARAVFGHVEPTFDWTLQVGETKQGLGAELVTGMSTRLFKGQPLGHVLKEYRTQIGVLNTQWATLRSLLENGNVTVRDALTRLRLAAIDRQSLVLLGDPTVTMPTAA